MPATLKSRLPMIAAELRPRVSGAVKETAEAIRDGAKERVPRDTDDLYNAIHEERVGPAAYAVVAGDDEDVFYGHIVEGGGVHTAPRPFLVPATEVERIPGAMRVTAVLRSL